MSIHYFIDPFTTNGDIIDVITASTGQSESTGSTIIRVPDGVPIHGSPETRNDLITAKYAGLLAFYAGFTDILADPCLDVSTADLTTSEGLLVSSGLVNHCILFPGIFSSTLFTLGFAPTQCVVVWEEYSYVDDDTKSDRYRRTYTEGPGTDLSCIVTFDNLAHTNSAFNGTVLNIPVPNQGTDFAIEFINFSGNRVYLGSWAVLYL